MGEHGIVGEVIVADNGSTDGSPEIAAALGARVVHVSARGYGNALMGGIAASVGRFVVMGDADDSYDFAELPKFVEKLREGLRPRAGLPARARRGTRHARCDAQAAPLVGQPDVHRDGALVVPRPGQRRLLRDARLHQGALREPDAAVHRHGVRHRDDHPLEPRQRPYRRGPDHPPPGRAQGARTSPAHVPRRVAHAALLPALQPSLALLDPRHRADRRRPRRVRRRPARCEHRRSRRSTPTRCCSPASPSSAATSRCSSRSSPRCSPSTKGCSRPTLDWSGSPGVSRSKSGLVVGCIAVTGRRRGAVDGTQPMARGRLRRARVLEHDAARRPWRDTRGDRLPHRAGELLRQRVRAPTAPVVVTANVQPSAAEFDAYATDYHTALDKGLSLSGEDSAFFAKGRVDWLRHRLGQLGHTAATVLDYGCGTGSTVPLLLELAGRPTGHRDRCLRRAARDRDPRAPAAIGSASSLSATPLSGVADLAYCNGVFHHIAPAHRARRRRLRRACASARRPVRVLGEQSVEPGHPADHATHPVRPRRRHVGPGRGATAVDRRWAGGREHRLQVLLPGAAPEAPTARTSPAPTAARGAVPRAGAQTVAVNSAAPSSRPRWWTVSRRVTAARCQPWA